MHRTLVALALAASILTTPAGRFEPLWNTFTRIWAEHGCILDPNGRCQPDQGTSSITGDNGCAADPDGRCIG